MSAFLLIFKANYLENMRGYFFFVDSNSPCKDLLLPHGPYLAQTPLYLVGTVLNLLNGFHFSIHLINFEWRDTENQEFKRLIIDLARLVFFAIVNKHGKGKESAPPQLNLLD